MSMREFFGSKTKGQERVFLFLILPPLSILVLVGTLFLLRSSMSQPPEKVASSESASPVSARPLLEPGALLERLEAAEALEKGGKIAEAEAIFSELTASNPESDRAWGGLGRTLLAEKKYRESASALEFACRLNVVEPRHFAARGAARRQLNDLKRAIRDYRDALGLQPDNVIFANTVLFIALELNDTGLLERSIAKFRRENPAAESQWILGQAASEMRFGTSASARPLFKRAQEILSPDLYQTLITDRIFADKRTQDVISSLKEEETQ